MPVPEIIILVIGGVAGIFLLLALLDSVFEFKWTCSTLGWHNGKGATKGFDGCSMTSKCSKCDADVLLDGQGNWFAITRKVKHD